MSSSQHVYEIRPRRDRRGFDLISDQLPLGLLWFEGPDAFGDAVSYAKFFSRSQAAIIRLFDQSGAVIETHEEAGDFKEWATFKPPTQPRTPPRPNYSNRKPHRRKLKPKQSRPKLASSSSMCRGQPAIKSEPHHSLNSPACSCVSITLPASS